MAAARLERMKRILSAVLLSTWSLACGGGAFTSGTDDPTDPGSTGDSAAPGDSGSPIIKIAPTIDLGDAGVIPVEPTVSPDAGAADVKLTPGALCCVGTVGSPDNVHCGVGAVAVCVTGDDEMTTYNSASCSAPIVGAACVAWPQSYGSPGACATSEPCCTGTVQVCP